MSASSPIKLELCTRGQRSQSSVSQGNPRIFVNQNRESGEEERTILRNLIRCFAAYEYIADSEVATGSQSLDTTLESIHTASLSYSELDTDADFSIEIPDLPMDEPLSSSELARLSKHKPPSGKPPRSSSHEHTRRSGRRSDRPKRQPDGRPSLSGTEHEPRRDAPQKRPKSRGRRPTPDSHRPSIWSPTRKASDASEHSLSASTPHSWSPRRSSTPGIGAKFEVPLEDVIVPLGQPAT